MRICVAHETLFHYSSPPSGVIQTLRLTPRSHTGQYVVDWRIDVSADCRLDPQEDAFGNIIHAFSTNGPIAELRLLVEGEVETQDVAGLVRGLSHEDAARFSFLLATPLILAAGVFKLPDLTGHLGDGVRGQALVGAACAAAAGLVSVSFLVRWFRTRTLWPFGIYCVVAGSACIAYFA